MRGLLFRIRRSGFLHGAVMIFFSLLGGMVLTVGGLVRVLFHFGLQKGSASGLNNFKEWLSWKPWGHDGRAYKLFMILRDLVVGVLKHWKWYIWIGIGMLVLVLGMFCYLLMSSGHHGEEKKPFLKGFEKVPYDIYLPVFLCGAVFMGLCTGYFVAYGGDIYLNLLVAFAGGTAVIFWVIGFLRVTAAKLYTGTLLSGTLIAGAGRFFWLLIRQIPFIWKAAAVWSGISFGIYILVLWMIYFYVYDDFIYVIWTFTMFALYLLGCWIILQMDMIYRKAQLLAEGKLEEKMEETELERTDRAEKAIKRKSARKHVRQSPMLPCFRRCLENLNRISNGINLAVDEKMKSERFQTELITNVSHDIKTPLTSIINYLDFLSQEEKKENPDPAAVEQYMEVLDRQSVRLKKLIEDLIEASKASTGSLSVDKEPCELGIFLQQIAGEYEEKLKQADLTLNLMLPEERIYVEADGRHLWRVVDNLLQNACKYAMSGTRVYLQLQEKAGQAKIVIKNVSALELNIPADELMERFVRGDRSRHSEGSGLGLSIAKSLTEIQDGRFSIEIDGDLFKAMVEFPVMEEEEWELSDGETKIG